MFEKRDLKFLKELIKDFKLSTQIKLTKVVDGKRKAKTLKELSDELHKHLEIRSDGQIVMKEHKYGNITESLPKQVSEKPKKEQQPEPPKTQTAPKQINSFDSFFIYDNEATKSSTMDLTSVYKLDDVNVFNDRDDLISVVGDVALMDWSYMQTPDAVEKFDKHITEMRTNNYNLYERSFKIIPRTFLNSINILLRIIQVFVTRNNVLVGFIRSKIEYKSILHIDYVFVSDAGFQGKGYVGEMMSLLFEYLEKINLLKTIDKVDLDYFPDSPFGWVAYDKGISRYGFKTKALKYTDEQLKDIKFVKRIDKKNQGRTIVWDKTKMGSGLIKRVQPIEMHI